jgi:hypothetical protein
MLLAVKPLIHIRLPRELHSFLLYGHSSEVQFFAYLGKLVPHKRKNFTLTHLSTNERSTRSIGHQSAFFRDFAIFCNLLGK